MMRRASHFWPFRCPHFEDQRCDGGHVHRRFCLKLHGDFCEEGQPDHPHPSSEAEVEWMGQIARKVASLKMWARFRVSISIIDSVSWKTLWRTAAREITSSTATKFAKMPERRSSRIQKNAKRDGGSGKPHV